MNTFQSIGVERQYGAKTKQQAQYELGKSCGMCLHHPGLHECKFCPIQAAHEIVMNGFECDDLNKRIEEKLKETQKRLGLI